MGQDIFVGVLCVIAVAAGIWSWWVDNGGTFKISDKHKEKKENEN